MRAGWRRCARRRAKDVAELARQLGVTRQYLSRILNGQTQTMPAWIYMALCAKLEIDPLKHLTTKEPPWLQRSPN